MCRLGMYRISTNMESKDVKTALLIFLTSFLAAPLIYTLDKLPAMESHFFIFLTGCLVLPLFALLSSVVVKTGRDTGRQDILFYVWSVFSFTAVVDLFIALELDGYVKGFMEFYLREGEPYLRSAYGTMINWWDGTGHFSMYISMIALLCAGKNFRELGLYWVGSIMHSMIVFLPGNVTGNKGLKWSYFLNVPYVVFPVYAGVRFLREGMRLKGKQIKNEKESWTGVAEGLMTGWFIFASIIAGLRFFAVMGCKEKITQDYITQIEPFLMDPTQYGRMQALVYFYYFMPFYVAAICCWWHGEQTWMKDWSIIHAGASAQAQFVFITCSLKWRTPLEHQVPDDVFARSVFWTVNLSLLIVPHLYALYCNRSKVVEFLSKVKDTKTREVTPGKPARNGPVTRQRKRLQNE